MGFQFECLCIGIVTVACTVMARGTCRSLLLLLSVPVALALDNGLARLPPMGWRSWEAFYGSITEAKMKSVMDALVDRSRGIDAEGVACTVGTDGCTGISLAELGF